jgi:hypothetical protein
MNEQKTFDKLRRVSYVEMARLIDIKNFPAPGGAPVYSIGASNFESTSFYNRDLNIHYWRIKTFEEHGWSFEEYMIESEKISIRAQITKFNEENTIPAALIERTKQFFPNVKFTSARVDLE